MGVEPNKLMLGSLSTNLLIMPFIFLAWFLLISIGVIEIPEETEHLTVFLSSVFLFFIIVAVKYVYMLVKKQFKE